MTKKLKLQIAWIIIIFLTGITVGFLGVYALQKSMTIKMTYRVMPEIRCELFLHRTADGQVGGEDIYNRIFSNLSGDEFVGEGIVLDEQQSTLAFQNTFAGGVGAGFKLRILNYTTENILVEATGTGVAYTSVELDAYEDSTLDTSNNILTVATVTNNIVLKFTKFIYSVAVNTYEGIDDTIPTTTSHYYCGNALIIPITATEYHSVPSQVSITTGNASSFGYEPIIEYNASNVATSVWNEAEITITPTSNCTINVYLNPWTYGQYVSANALSNQTVNTVWAGYYYVTFASATSVRWIIIGESENIYSNYSNQTNPEPANSGLLNTDTSICPALKDSDDSIKITSGLLTTTPNIKPKTRMFQELIDNQVLLYKETTVLDNTEYYSTRTSGAFEWSNSDLSEVLNGTYYTTTQNLDDYENYIVLSKLYTSYTSGVVSWNYHGTNTDADSATYINNRILTESTEKIFVLSSLSGYEATVGYYNYKFLSFEDYNEDGIIDGGASGMGCGILGSGVPTTLFNESRPSGTYQKTVNTSTANFSGYEIFIMQNFNIEVYLGGYTFDDETTNSKIFVFSDGAGENNDIIWLRHNAPYINNCAGIIRSLGMLDNDYVDNNNGVRPAFVLDLAKNYVSAT